MSKPTPATQLAAPREYLALANALAEVNGDVPCRTSADWYSDSYKVRALAADQCWDCPVLFACAAYADAAGERWGVWAGADRTTHPTKRKDSAA